MTWDRIHDALEELSLVELRSKNWRAQMLTDTTDEQRNILKKLDVKQPNRVRKFAPPAQIL